MSAGKLAAIVAIYGIVSAGWAILGQTTAIRSSSSYQDLRSSVSGTYGSPVAQTAPVLTVREKVWAEESVAEDETGAKASDREQAPRRRGERPTKTVSRAVEPDSSVIRVELDGDVRRKGLVWYRTYGVVFDATYTLTDPFARDVDSEDAPPEATSLLVEVALPSATATYLEFTFSVNDQTTELTGDLSEGLSLETPLAPGEEAVVHLRYATRGMDRWTYAFGAGTTAVAGLDLSVKTDFGAYDFPADALSPTSHGPDGAGGWTLNWVSDSMLTSRPVIVEVPGKLNPGPLSSRISYFAPVGLLFFLAVTVIIGVIRGCNLHPMHYFFVCGAFFAFHLLFAYLVDHLEINAAFVIASVTSVLLVASYLLRIQSRRFVLLVAAPAQTLFLVLFSYAFFFKGYTGLTITIASIVTLAVMMQVTAKVNWDERLRSGRNGSSPPPPHYPPPPSVHG